MNAARESAGLRLLPVMPPAPARALTACLAAFCARVAVAGVLLPAAEGLVEEEREALVKAVHACSAAAFVPDDAALCLRLNADGAQLHTDDPARVRAAREALGRDRVIGVCCPSRRHAAMELGEAGADYLAIDQRVEASGENLLAWWAEMFTPPVLAARPAAPDELPALARLGADFATPLPAMWESPERAAALAEDYARELAALGA